MSPEQQQFNDEISLKELIEKIQNLIRYLLKKWYILFFACILGGASGFLYSYLRPVKYISRLTFVVEENNTSMGGLASLASQFGFNIGGANSGVFSGDNVLLFLKSESLCREALLTNYDSSGKVLLADKYAEVYDLKTKWLKNKQIGKDIVFAKNKDGNFPRLEDSLLQLIIKKILKYELEITKLDSKGSFIELTATTRDELLSKYLNERLLKIGADHYIESKIKVKSLNVAKLQRRADSLGILLNNKTYSAAATQQVLVDVNPAIRTAPVTAEITARDKTMIATIFSEVVKNLEIAKVLLTQETPVIQIVDTSYLPLKKDKIGKLTATLVALIIALVLTSMFLLVRNWWRKNKNHF